MVTSHGGEATRGHLSLLDFLYGPGPYILNSECSHVTLGLAVFRF